MAESKGLKRLEADLERARTMCATTTRATQQARLSWGAGMGGTFAAGGGGRVGIGVRVESGVGVGVKDEGGAGVGGVVVEAGW